MYRHIVMFRFADETEGRSKKENISIMKKNFESFVLHLDYVKNFVFGVNDEVADSSNYDVVMTCDFDSFEDIAAYGRDKEHLAAKEESAPCFIGRACVDFKLP